MTRTRERPVADVGQRRAGNGSLLAGKSFPPNTPTPQFLQESNGIDLGHRPS